MQQTVQYQISFGSDQATHDPSFIETFSEYLAAKLHKSYVILHSLQ